MTRTSKWVWALFVVFGCAGPAPELADHGGDDDIETLGTVEEALTQTACDIQFNHGGDLGGNVFDMTVNCSCHPGFKRRKSTTSNDGPGSCFVTKWSSSDPHDCNVEVRVQNSAGGLTGTCHVLVDEYDKCQPGAPLNKEDTCIERVCRIDQVCCSSTWDRQCVEEVPTVCNTLACRNPACPHAECTIGAAMHLDAAGNACSPSVKAICDTDPYCCNTEWDSICVGEVPSLTGKNCQ